MLHQNSRSCSECKYDAHVYVCYVSPSHVCRVSGFKFLSFLHRDITFHKRMPMHLRLDFFPLTSRATFQEEESTHLPSDSTHCCTNSLFSNITQPSIFKLPDRVFISCVSHKPSLSPPTHCLSKFNVEVFVCAQLPRPVRQLSSISRNAGAVAINVSR